jgi:hypothetical protein
MNERHARAWMVFVRTVKSGRMNIDSWWGAMLGLEHRFGTHAFLQTEKPSS